MPISYKSAMPQIQRLSGLPYYGTLSHIAIAELVNALASSAPTEEVAQSSVSDLLTDTCRASNIESNRVPSPGELIAWVNARIEASRCWEPPQRPDFCIRCSGSGRIGPHGWKPDWTLPTAQIMEQCEANKIPCPDCQAVPA